MNDETMIEIQSAEPFLASAGNFAPRAFNYSAATLPAMVLANDQTAVAGGIRLYQTLVKFSVPSQLEPAAPGVLADELNSLRLASASQFWALEDSLPDNPEPTR